jgi:type IV pilus assembly protein PilM
MAFSLSTLFASVQKTANAGVTKTVGIDLGSSSVKVVEIEETERALTLRTYGELQLGPYDAAPLGDMVQLSQKKRIESIVDVMRESGASAPKGVLVIPLAVSFMTVIPVAAKADEDITSKVAVEARKYIPIPLSDVALDWVEIGGADAKSSVREVLIAAVEHATVRDYKDTLQAIGLASQPSEIEAFSLVRALNRTDDTTLAVLDIGARTTKLYIARNGSIERIHRVAAGGVAITKRLAEMRSLSFEDAENLKRSYSDDREAARDIQKATTSVLDAVFLECKRIMDQYEARIGEPIGRTVLAGGVASFVGTPAYARDALGREVEVGNVFDKLAYPAFMEDTLAEIAPSFGVAIGAALRHFSE